MRRPYPLIRAVIAEAFGACGVGLAQPPNERVNEESLAPVLAAAFGTVHVESARAALLFHEPEPIVAYVHSLLGFYSAPPAGTGLERLTAWVEEEVPRRLESLGGTWRDPKGYAVFTCRA